jgi:thiamine-phosphate pyrophosphorylase
MTPRLIVVTDTTVVERHVMLARIERLLHAALKGSVMVQLRDKELPVRERLALGVRLRELTRETRQGLCVNDRIDLAALLDADGVHLGEASVRAQDVRARFGPEFWISIACHDPDAPCSDSRRSDSPDAEILSPICAARKGTDARGFGALARRRSRLKENSLLYALGGVTATQAVECIENGADGVAAIGAAIGVADATPLLKALKIASC